MGVKIKFKAGDTLNSRRCGEYEIIKINGFDSVLVRFKATQTLKTVKSSQLKTGYIKDNLAPIVCGIGFHGSGDHRAEVDGVAVHSYSIWSGMISRCYNKNSKAYKRYGGRGVKVCIEWHNYQNFAEWCLSQRFYGLDGYNVDKDIINPSSKIYSPQNCAFVPAKINKMLTNSNLARGKYPVGVSKHVSSYSAAITINGIPKKKYGFKTPEDAFNYYKIKKEGAIKSAAEDAYLKGEVSKKVYQSLIDWNVTPFPD